MKKKDRPTRAELLDLAKGAAQDLPDSWPQIAAKLEGQANPGLGLDVAAAHFQPRMSARKWIAVVNVLLVLVVGGLLFSVFSDRKKTGSGPAMKNLLVETAQGFQFKGLEWNMTRQQVIHALRLGEGDYEMQQDQQDGVGLLLKHPVQLFESLDVKGIAAYLFYADQLLGGGYRISAESFDEMVLAVKASVKQFEDWGFVEELQGTSGGINELLQASSQTQFSQKSFRQSYTWTAWDRSQFILSFIEAPGTPPGFELGLAFYSYRVAELNDLNPAPPAGGPGG